MKVLTAAEMREVDRLTSERYAIPTLQLMETAGSRVAEACCHAMNRAAAEPRRIAVLCGKGNNGGDGFVAARHLQSSGTKVTLYLFSEPRDLQGDAATNFHRWTAIGTHVISITDETAWQTAWPEISNANVIVDAIFGTGFRGAATGVIASAISAINRYSKNATAARPALILAVDTPSGLPSDGQPAQGPVLWAHRTVTFTTPKPGQLISRDSAAVGMLEVAEIGSPSSLVEEIGRGPLRWVEPYEFAELPLVRTVDSHKGLYGHALIVAGSLGKTGAAVMAGYAALRAGAGLVTVATPDLVLPIIASPDGQIFVNTSGNPGLAKGGSGDVLTGVLAALTAQFKTADWTRVLALGVYLHGKAAEFAAKNTDESGLFATEVAAAVPHARHQLLQGLQARE